MMNEGPSTRDNREDFTFKIDRSYKGKDFEDVKNMSLQELAAYLPARARRRLNRGINPYDRALMVKAKLKNLKGLIQKIRSRCIMIIPEDVDIEVNVYNGKTYEKLKIVPGMIGRLIGDFIRTKKTVKHGKKGIGASRSTKYVALK